VSARSVLVIGFDPHKLPPAAFSPEQAVGALSEEAIAAAIRGQAGRMREAGFDYDQCHIDTGATAEAAVTAKLRSRRYDCVVIGAGVRTRAEYLHLFEKVLNLVHELAPGSRIAFATNPADVLEAAQRWL